ncbi:MAG: DUF1467 family protein [Pelagibacteraceae bacterium]
MSLTGSIVVFIILWWLIFFTILPINIKSQLENSKVIKGTDPGAPNNPQIVKKIIITTFVVSILFVIIYLLAYLDILNLRDLLS